VVLSDELYEKFINLIYKKTGLHYEYNKKYFVEKRIIQYAKLLQCCSLNEYYMWLKFATDQSEFFQLINDLTVNETYFFRDFPQLRNFAEDVLPLVEKRKMDRRKIKIWCAACSTGEEAYTLSIILKEMLDEPAKWDIQIIASDINSEVLQRAKTGLYDSRAIKDVPLSYLEKYFRKRQDKYLINHDIRQSVSFLRINLMDARARSSITGCDFIFCRNCLIYFDDLSRKSVVMSFYQSLNPEGFLFLGHSESVGRITSSYKAKKIGDTVVYSRPKE
jgi:Methylase of chemotaxis methyl-accepting proteins